jgi:DNA/RNA-binding domain of Phe-tRNA-synthetase-like protein
MAEIRDHQAFLDGARVDPEIFRLRPDYRVGLLAVDDVVPGPSDLQSEALLQKAEKMGQELLAGSPVEELPQVVAWREAYRAFGAKPQRTRNSLEALLRRSPAGLPRVNRLTDIYNAISVIHQIPIGGEDLDRYLSSPRLIRASGTEPFETTMSGEDVTEHPEPGEVVWVDHAGVTCRRWNWRQCRRTQLQVETVRAVFILDALAPVSTDALNAALDDLVHHLNRLGPNISFSRRLFGA